MHRKVEVQSKSSSKTTKSSITTTTVTTWKSSSQQSSSSSRNISTTNLGQSSSSSLALKNGIKSTDRLAIEPPRIDYVPVYPRTTSTTTKVTQPTIGSKLFYTFPKSPPETKYSSSGKLGPSGVTISRPTTKDAQVNRTPIYFSQPSKPTSSPIPSAATKSAPHDDHIYSQSYLKSKRVVYILNHFKYDKEYQKQRDGSLEDVKQLTKTLSSFNVTIKERHDQKKADIIKMAKTQSEKNYKNFDFVAYIIMTHGGVEKTLAARDAMYNLERDFINVIQTNKTLVGVPKVFIIQACRGDLETDATPFRSPATAPNDTLKLFATYEGYVSYRTTAGTYFIQELCSKLAQHGESEELMTIMRRVTLEVSKKAPTPEQSSTLQRALHLGRIKK